jgi:hypothetical protein
MMKKDALEFLELPESASPSEIKMRIDERLGYFENLNESTPSDFLKRVYSKRIQALKEIEIDSSEWEPAAVELLSPKEELVQQESERVQEDEFQSMTPISGPAGSAQSEQHAEESPAVGWLVRHTENQSSKTFPLMPGKNFIGRKLRPSVLFFALIDDDPYISRVHAVIYVEDASPYDFYICDSNDDNDGSASKNGTYINGDKTRVTKKTKLKENDTIQVGVTKLVLKYTHSDIKKIINDVEKRDYISTVAIDI